MGKSGSNDEEHSPDADRRPEGRSVKSEVRFPPLRDYAEQVVETVREPLLVLDPSLTVRAVNRSFYATFRVAPEQTLGRFVYELGNGQWDIPELRELLEDLLPASKQVTDFEVTHNFEHIGPKTMLLNARRIERQGEPQMVLLAIEDVTERRRSERALKEAEERLRRMVESASDYALITTDVDRTITSWSHGAERIFGYEEADILGRSADILFTPEDRAEGAPERETGEARTNGHAPDERWHLKQDGSRFYASGMVTPLNDEAGELLGFTKVARDATAQKRTEEALDEQRELMATITNHAAEALFLMDESGRVTFLNPAAEAMFGWPKGEVMGQVLHDLLHYQRPDGSPYPMRECPLGRVMTAGEAAHNHEDVFFRRDGSPVPVLCSNAPVLRDGRVAGAVLVVNEITERKRLEDELRRRLVELSDADRRKDEFLAMLAHELRNPLSAIHSAVRVAQSPKMAEHLPQTLDVIQRQAGNLARLIDDLLDVSRITRGQVDLRRETVDLIGVIDRAAQATGPLFEKKHHELTFQHDFGPTWVDADPTRLEQILGNLLANAAKYTEPGGHIAVSASRRGNEAVIKVRDDGVGIPPEMLPKIFELFTQVDRSLARSEGGLGIGLSLVKRLVEMHGGSTTATSKVGHGSEFTVTLPLVEAVAEETEREPAEEISGAGKRVLIVDDNVDTARLTGRLLKSLGYEVRLCHDGGEAIEAAREFRPEVVLLDIGLPGLNGFEVARQLREEACCLDSLIIGISGYGDQQARERARESGFDHHLVKPVDIEAVTKLVSRPRRP